MSIVIIEVNGDVLYASPGVAVLNLDTLPEGPPNDFSAEAAADHFAEALACATYVDERAMIYRYAEARGITVAELDEAVALYRALHGAKR